MASKLELYNEALIALGSRKLASLTTDTEPRRALDEVYTRVVNYCLEQGNWKFAQRTSKLDYSPSVSTEFGYTYGFAMPTDLIHPFKICIDEDLKVPLVDFSEEDGYWFAYVDTIYITYTSNHVDFGWNVSEWPESFAYFVSMSLAKRIFNRVKGDSDGAKLQSKKDIEADLRQARAVALNKDALKGPPMFMPTGTWSAARSGNNATGGRRDRGSRGTLIG